jgi:signal transduction histidine kinase
MGQHVHELLHVAAAVLFAIAGASALFEYRTLRERVVLTYGAMCLCAAAYATHIAISHNLPKLGAFWMPWTSAVLAVTFGATLFYLLTMRAFLNATGRVLSAAVAIQVALVAIVLLDLAVQAIGGRSLLFLPIPRTGLSEAQRAMGEEAYTLRPLAEAVAGSFMLSFVAGVAYLLWHLVRTRSRDALVYAGLLANAAIVTNDVVVALGAFTGGMYLMALSKAFETLRINRDIRNRARERVERRLRQAEKMEAIGRMAGGIAHDFNNILQVVEGNVLLAVELEREGQPATEELAAAVDGVETGRRLVSQLLDVARAKERAAEYVDVHDFLAQTTKLLTSMLSKSMRLEVKSEAGLGGVMMDQSQLTQVLMNLVANARDAMPEGGTIEIRAAREVRRPGRAAAPNASPRIVISVLDQGTGIPADVIEHVFEPFFTTKGPRGSGLGLATLYSIVTRAGGQVDVESEVGRGTCFHVLLPLHQAQTAASAE